MKRIVAFILIPVMLFLFCACGKAAEPVSSSAPPESANDGQPHYTGPGPSDIIIHTKLNAVTPNADAKKMISEDVDLFGLTDEITQEDIPQIFGEPKDVIKEGDASTFEKTIYVYDGMRFTFNDKLYGEPYTATSLYVADFTRDDLTYPRGIKLGDSLYDVVAKFPQERDYRSEVMYGDPMDKYTTGFARLLNYDVLTQEEGNYCLLICCGLWPIVCINFDNNLNTKSVNILYHSNGIG